MVRLIFLLHVLDFLQKLLYNGSNWRKYMVKTIEMLHFEYRSFGNVYNKIAREERDGNLIKLKRGLYATQDVKNQLVVANYIFAPSYISFETALAYYNMIPERVYLIKSATYKKNKTLVGNEDQCPCADPNEPCPQCVDK